jgi:GNAT superfamily N-acetyltransferase
MRYEVRPLSPELRDEFFHLHSDAHDGGWCYCVAWWVDTWDGWGDRTAGENRSFREALFDRGEYDGYLLFADAAVAGWCQVGPRDRLEKLVRQFQRPADPEVWAVTCFFVAPDHRRQGGATRLLRDVLTDLKRRGVKTVEAYPSTTETEEEGEHWTGPLALYAEAGFRHIEAGAKRCVMSLDL